MRRVFISKKSDNTNDSVTMPLFFYCDLLCFIYLVYIIKKDILCYQNVTLFPMVPPRRIELRIDPYHGSVIPLNYGGKCVYYKYLIIFIQLFLHINHRQTRK